MDDLLERFEARTLTPEDWTHAAHLAVACAYLERFPFPESLVRLRFGILALNASHGVPTTPTSGYHETITRAFLHLIEAEMESMSGPFVARVAEVQRRLSDKRVLLRHYSRALINSKEARYAWVEPDLEPLPRDEIRPASKARAHFFRSAEAARG